MTDGANAENNKLFKCKSFASDFAAYYNYIKNDK